jgi:hypothetical protein
MGIVNRLKKRVKGGLKLARTIVDSVSEEARHPGRPPSNMASNSPFWQDDTNDIAHQKAREGIAAAKAEPEPEASGPPEGLPPMMDTEGRDNEPFWFLKDGNDDGWDTTNPSEEWRKRHGDEAPEDYGSGG